MALQLQDYRGNVRGLLDDSSYDAAIVDQAINWIVYELCNNNHLRIMEDSDQLFGSAGDTELDFPDTMMTLIQGGFYLTSPQAIEMGTGYVGYGDFMRNYSNFASASQAQARTWTDYGNKIRFAAPLNASHTFQVDFLREPARMDNDTSECELPDRYEELITKGALARVMEVNEDYIEALQERNNLSSLMTTFIRNESRGGIKTGPNVIGRGRSGRGGWNAARDF